VNKDVQTDVNISAQTWASRLALILLFNLSLPIVPQDHRVLKSKRRWRKFWKSLFTRYW